MFCRVFVQRVRNRPCDNINYESKLQKALNKRDIQIQDIKTIGTSQVAFDYADHEFGLKILLSFKVSNLKILLSFKVSNRFLIKALISQK